jgi:hypothetical protein
MHGGEGGEHVRFIGGDVLLFWHGVFVFQRVQRVIERLDMWDEIFLSASPRIIDEI